jgi:hypothetical protein
MSRGSKYKGSHLVHSVNSSTRALCLIAWSIQLLARSTAKEWRRNVSNDTGSRDSKRWSTNILNRTLSLPNWSKEIWRHGAEVQSRRHLCDSTHVRATSLANKNDIMWWIIASGRLLSLSSLQSLLWLLGGSLSSKPSAFRGICQNSVFR